MADSNGISIDDDHQIPEWELQWRFTTSSGPGGQHANRSATRAELTWFPDHASGFNASERRRLVGRLGSPVVVRVDEERSQHRNRELAKSRLAERVRAALAVRRRRRATRPTRGSTERRLQNKQQRSQLKAQRRRPAED